LLHNTGIFYVPGMMPDWIRDMLAWNPVLQGVDWFRASFFGDYVPHWLDRSYLAAVAGLVLWTCFGKVESSPMSYEELDDAAATVYEGI